METSCPPIYCSSCCSVICEAGLKRHFPAAFTAALVRNQPMGFYSSQSLLNSVLRVYFWQNPKAWRAVD